MWVEYGRTALTNATIQRANGSEKKVSYWNLFFIGLLLISFSGCQGDSDKEPVSKLTPEQRQQQEADKETAFATLLQLESRFGQVSFAQGVQDSKICVRLADELMLLELNADERRRTIVSLFNALTKLHATREIKSSERLSVLAEEYSTDTDQGVVRAARIAKVAVDLVKYIRTQYGAYEPLKQGVEDLLRAYPEDMEIASNLETVAIRLFQRGKSKNSNEIMAMMLDVYSSSKSQEMKRYAGILGDRIKLVECKFRNLVQNLELGGADDRSKFIAMLEKLTSDQSIGFTAYEEIARAGRWLERIQRYDTAGKVYQIIGRRFSEHPQPQVAKAAQIESRSGLKRLKQIGTKIELRGETVFGDAIDPADYQDKVVLLMFWSAEKPISLQAMGELFPLYARFSREQFEIIAIATDDDAKKPIEVLGTQVPPWTILLPNVGKKENDEKTLIEECAVNYVPYTVLVDPEGRVQQINISGNVLEDRIKQLLIKSGKIPIINEPANGPQKRSPVDQTG